MNDLASIKSTILARVGAYDNDALMRELRMAWEEMWLTADLTGSVWQGFVKPASYTDRFVTFPANIMEVRMIKNAPMGWALKSLQPTAFYTNPKVSQTIDEIRQVGSSPLMNSMTAVSRLVLSVDVAPTSDLAIVIVGQAQGSDRVRETVTIRAGQLSATSQKSFGPRIDSISKGTYSPSDITIKDGAGNLLSVLPNSFVSARYVIVQLLDNLLWGPNSAQWSGAYDVIYKTRAPVLWFDEDTIPIPHHLSLINQTISNILSGRAGEDKRAGNFGAKATTLSALTQNNQVVGSEQGIIVGDNSGATNYRGWI